MAAPENVKSMNLYQKIIHIMTKIDGVTKEAFVATNNSGAGYAAVEHDDVTFLLHAPCAEMGIVVSPSVTKAETSMMQETEPQYNKVKKTYRCDLWIDVTFINADKPEERFVSSAYAYAMDSSDKAMGKAYSMAVKYVYLKTFMLKSFDREENRDYEHDQTNNDSNRNKSKSSNNDSRNNSGNPNGSNTKPGSSNHGDINNGDKKDKPASESQISAIKKISATKGIQVDEKFRDSKNCSSREASAEIARLNTKWATSK